MQHLVAQWSLRCGEMVSLGLVVALQIEETDVKTGGGGGGINIKDELLCRSTQIKALALTQVEACSAIHLLVMDTMSIMTAFAALRSAGFHFTLEFVIWSVPSIPSLPLISFCAALESSKESVDSAIWLH